MLIVFFKQKTAYEMRISDWSSDVCSSDLTGITSPSTCRSATTIGVMLIGLGVDLRSRARSSAVVQAATIPLAVPVRLARTGAGAMDLRRFSGHHSRHHSREETTDEHQQQDHAEPVVRPGG